MPPADPLPPVVVQYQSVSQMRPKGMNNGNEGSEFGPTLQSVKGDIVTSDQAFTKWGGTQMFRKKQSRTLTINTKKKERKRDGAPGLKPS